jgi:hypothetical protein
MIHLPRHLRRKQGGYILAPQMVGGLITQLAPQQEFPILEGTNTSTEASDTTSHTINLPASIVSGDGLIISMAMTGVGQDPTITGWNLRQYVQAGSTSIAIFTRTANGTEGATVTASTNQARKSAHTSVRVSRWGGNDLTDIHVSDATTGTSFFPDITSTTVPWGVKKSLFMQAVGIDGGRTVTAYPTNYPDNRLNPNVFTAVGTALATRLLKAGIEDPDAFTISASDQWAAFLVVVEPNYGLTPPAIQAFTTDASIGLLHQCTYPAGIAFGDLLLLFLGGGQNGARWSNLPTGWAELDQRDYSSSGSGALFRKFALSTESGSFNATYSSFGRGAAIMVRISPWNWTPLSFTAVTAEGVSKDPPLLSGQDAEIKMWLAVAMNDNDSIITSWPKDFQLGKIVASGQLQTVALAAKTASSTSENPSTISMTQGAGGLAYTVAAQA